MRLKANAQAHRRQANRSSEKEQNKDQFSSPAGVVMFSMMIFVAPARSIMTDLPTSCNPLLS